MNYDFFLPTTEQRKYIDISNLFLLKFNWMCKISTMYLYLRKLCKKRRFFWKNYIAAQILQHRLLRVLWQISTLVFALMHDDYSFSIFPFFDHDFSSQHSKWVALSTSSSPSSTPPPGQYSTFQPTKVREAVKNVF